jgi:nicotinamidase-related amidase
MLRNAGIITIVFTGIATEIGIESSARDAFNRGFYSVVISDCVCLRHLKMDMTDHLKT